MLLSTEIERDRDRVTHAGAAADADDDLVLPAREGELVGDREQRPLAAVEDRLPARI